MQCHKTVTPPGQRNAAGNKYITIHVAVIHKTYIFLSIVLFCIKLACVSVIQATSLRLRAPGMPNKDNVIPSQNLREAIPLRGPEDGTGLQFFYERTIFTALFTFLVACVICCILQCPEHGPQFKNLP